MLAALAIFLSGCVRTRAYSVVRDRVDQDLTQGNAGYLSGAKPAGQEVGRKTTRTVYVVETELTTSAAKKQGAKAVNAPSGPVQYQESEAGNQGYLQTEATGASDEISGDEATAESQKETTFTDYTVQKGDTLEKIAAKAEIYGSGKKWYRIYKANQDKLKSPNRIYPGQVIRIPRD